MEKYGDPNEYPQHTFLWRIKQNYHQIPSFVPLAHTFVSFAVISDECFLHKCPSILTILEVKAGLLSLMLFVTNMTPCLSCDIHDIL